MAAELVAMVLSSAVPIEPPTCFLVPDLPEGLTTTYEFEDRGPAPR
ncbi:hypothetical protein [Micromonospora sp. NPDC005189]